MWPSQTPSGIAIAVAISVAAIESCRWVQVRSQISPSPPTRTVPACDSRSWKMKSIASPKGPRAARIIDSPPAPGGRGTLDDEHDQLERGGQQDHQQRRRDDVAAEGRVGEDLGPEPAGAREEGEAR